jgi:plasmid stabilization system protein ParE
MKYQIRFTDEALADMDRLYDYMIEWDLESADRSYETLLKSMKLLEVFPFSCRKARGKNAFLRELVVPFGSTGYVVLFSISSETVTIAAVRHQREDDYH